MHELSLAQSLLDLATEYAGGLPITVLRVRIGPLSGIVTESLDFSFEFLSKDTLTEGARLEYERVPLHVVCKACGAPVAVEAWGDLPGHEALAWAMDQGCACGSKDLRVEGGFEFQLVEIEVKDAEGGNADG